MMRKDDGSLIPLTQYQRVAVTVAIEKVSCRETENSCITAFKFIYSYLLSIIL